MDIVIYQKLETGTEHEHDRKHEKENKLPCPVECTMFRLLPSPLTLRAGRKRNRGEMGQKEK
jgi:hypothetical protein